MFKITTKPKRQLRLKLDCTILDKSYKKGDLFTIVGSNGMRGYDIQDKDGKIIYEVALIMESFEEINVNLLTC